MNGGNAAAWGSIGEALDGGILETVYGIDIRGFMRRSPEKWGSG